MLVYRSDLVGSAVGGDGGASCEACQIAGQKQCRIRDFVRFAEPAQRYPGNAIGAELSYRLARTGLVGQIVATGCCCGTGDDHVDSDPAPFQLVGPGAGKRTNGGFGGGIDPEAFAAPLGGGGPGDDDRGSVVQQ